MTRIIVFLAALLSLSSAALAQPCLPWRPIVSPDAPAAERTWPRAIHVSGPDDVWIVGEALVGNQIRAFSMHWNGSSWSHHAVPVPDDQFADFGMWALGRSPSGELWAAGHREFSPSIPYAFFGTHNAVWRWSGAAWQLLKTPELGGGSGDFIWGLTALAADDVWFVGDHHPQPMGARPALAMHWDGSAFTVTNVPIVNPETGRNAGNPLNDVSAISPTDVWAVGGTDVNAQGAHAYSNIHHWNGTRWTHVPGPTPGFFNQLFTVAAIAPDNVWAAGEYWDVDGVFALLLHWDGSAWTEQPSPGGFLDMVALDADDIWAVGGNAVYHFDGSRWTVAASFTEFMDARLASISGSHACELWATGQESTHTFVVRGSGSADNLPPTASFTFACNGLTCAFNGNGSADSDGAVSAYYWNFGDSTTAEGATASHTFLQAGTYTTTLIVTDDEGARGSTVRQLTVDSNLRVTTLQAPVVAAAGAAITVTDTTANVGTTGNGASATVVWFSADRKLGGDSPLGSRTTGALLGGASSTGSIAGTIPAVKPGAYYLIAQADGTGTVNESNEVDNTRMKVVYVGPDLVVKSTSFVPANPSSGVPTRINVTTRNGGADAAGPSKTRLYRSADATLGLEDALLAEFDVPMLVAGQERMHSVIVTFPAGTYYVIAVSDASKGVLESREQNNTRAVRKSIP